MAIIATSNKQVTVGTSVVVISEEKLNNYSERIRLIITNTSTGGQNITVSVDADAVAGNGIFLYPGGAISWERDASFAIQQKRVMAVASAANGTVSVYEEVLNRGAL